MNYFTDAEFKCKCDQPDCTALTAPSQELVVRLNIMRSFLNRPVIITSGIRCPRHNAESGGQGPEHVRGEAADLAVGGSRSRYEMVEAARRAGFNRIGVAKTFIHVGVSQELDTNVLWLY